MYIAVQAQFLTTLCTCQMSIFTLCFQVRYRTRSITSLSVQHRCAVHIVNSYVICYICFYSLHLWNLLPLVFTGFLLMISMTKYHIIHYQLLIHVSSAVSTIYSNLEIGQWVIGSKVIGMLLGCYYTNHT